MKKTPLLLIIALFTLTGHAQIISTVAGNHVEGYSGDGGPATAAELHNPWSTAIDAAGNLYIADALNNCIRKVDAAGIISTYAGTTVAGNGGDGGPASAAQLNYPDYLALDTHGNLYIADVGNNIIRRVDAAGIITTFAGNDTAGYNGDGIPATAARLNNPYGVATDTAGNVYIADASSHRIRKVDAAGIITTVAGTGVWGYSGDGAQATDAKLYVPQGVAVDNAGNIYIEDVDNYRVRKVDVTGVITTIAGTGTEGTSGDGGPATAAELKMAPSIAVDARGNVYLPGYGGHNVRMIDSAGIITSIAGVGYMGYGGDGGPATNAGLFYPAGVTVSEDGTIYIADAFNNCVRKITPAIPTGIKNAAMPSLVIIYPNPAQDKLTLTLPSLLTEATLRLYSITGNVVLERTLPANITTQALDVTGIARGIYLLQIKGDGLSSVNRVVVE